MPPPASGLPRLPNQGHPPLIPVLSPSFPSILRSSSPQVSGLLATPKPHWLRLSPPSTASSYQVPLESAQDKTTRHPNQSVLVAITPDPPATRTASPSPWLRKSCFPVPFCGPAQAPASGPVRSGLKENSFFWTLDHAKGMASRPSTSNGGVIKGRDVKELSPAVSFGRVPRAIPSKNPGPAV